MREWFGRGDSVKAQRGFIEMWESPLKVATAGIIGLLLAVAAATVEWGDVPIWLVVISFVGVWWFSWLAIAPVLMALVLWTVNAVGTSVDVVLVRPLAWVLEQPNLAPIARTGALLIFLAGFTFDLLAYA